MRRSTRRRSGRGLPACLVVLLGTALADGSEPRTWAVTDAHAESILDVAFSPDGRTLATASRDGTAKLWDLARGRTRATLDVHPGRWVNAVAFSPDGTLVATGGGGGWPREGVTDVSGDLELWDAATASRRRTIRTPGRGVLQITFSRDGRRVGTIDADRTARTWDVADGKMQTEAKLPAQFGPAAFGPDLATLAAGDETGVVLIEVATGREVARLDVAENRPQSLAFSADGKSLACGAGSPSMGFGRGGGPQAELGQGLGRLRRRPPGAGIAEGPRLRGLGRRVLARRLDDRRRRIRGAGGRLGRRHGRPAGDAPGVVQQPRCPRLRGGWQDAGRRRPRAEHHALGRRDVGPLHPARRPRGGPARLSARRQDAGRRFQQWHGGPPRPRDGSDPTRPPVGPLHRLCGHRAGRPRDGSRVAAGFERGGVALWDPVSGALRGGFGFHHLGPVTALAFAPDGKSVASGGKEGVVRLGDISQWREVAALRGHTFQVVGLAFTPDGKTLASAGADGTIKLWDVEARRERQRPRPHRPAGEDEE